MEKKMTSRIALTYVLNSCELPADVKDKLEQMLTSLDRKNANGSKNLTPVQKENAELAILFADALTTEPQTVSNIIKSIDFPALIGDKDMTTQRATPILAKLVEEGKAIKTVIKGRAHYSKTIEG